MSELPNAIATRFKKLDEADKLIKFNQLVDWEVFRSDLEKVRFKPRKSNGGRKPFDVVLMFKMLVLQRLYNLSDDDLEFRVRDSYTFSRFIGISYDGVVPDSKTIWLFKEELGKQKLVKTLFYRFDEHLLELGYKPKGGQIIDASFVEVPKQRNSKEENAQIKLGEIPESFTKNEHKMRQKDTDARWTKKNSQSYYGYKNHINIDNEHKLIRSYEVTSAEVHDSNVFFVLFIEMICRTIWADSAYRTTEHEQKLKENNWDSQVHEKGYRNHPLSEASKKSNHQKSKTRERVEHVFGAMTNDMRGMLSRAIGKERNTTHIGLMNLTYNLKRFVFLHSKVAS